MQFGSPPGEPQIFPLIGVFTVSGQHTDIVDYLHEYSDPDGWANLQYVQALTGVGIWGGAQLLLSLFFAEPTVPCV
jgi:hypothetical protein